MKTPRTVGIASVCAGSALLAGFGVHESRAGQLQPPAGPVNATMKSLDAIEPRRCINDLPGDADAVHVISEPGSYFLCADVIGKGGSHGIVVRLAADSANDRVSIDLGGFSLVGVPGSLDGLHIAPAQGNLYEEVTVKPIRLELSSISGWGGNGVHVESAIDVELSGMNIGSSGLDGVCLVGAESVRIKNLRSVGNAGNGVRATLLSRQAREGFFDIGISSTMGNGGHGVLVERAEGSISFDKVFSVDSSSCGNLGNGLHTDGISSVRMENGLYEGNQGEGVSVLYGSVQPGQPQYGNITFERCRMTTNGSHGLSLSLDSDVDFEIEMRGNTTSRNGAAGIVGDGVSCSEPGGSGGGGRVALSMFDHSTLGNLGDGVRCRWGHGAAMTSVRNMKAVANGGSGADIGPLDPAIQLLDIAVSFIDCFCVHNGADGFRLERCEITAERSTGQNNGACGWCMIDSSGALSLCAAIENGGDGFQASGAFQSKKGYDYYKAQSEANGSAGLHHNTTSPIRCQDGVCRGNEGGGGLIISASVCHFISSGFEDNTGNGLTLSGVALSRSDGCFLWNNTGHGALVDGNGQVCGSTSHFLRGSADGNGLDGIAVLCAVSGQVTECQAHRNGGAGIRIGDERTLGAVMGVHVDRCYAGNNAEGIVVDDMENIVLRSIGAHNALDNMRVHAASLSGPSPVTPMWTEVKPYVWP